MAAVNDTGASAGGECNHRTFAHAVRCCRALGRVCEPQVARGASDAGGGGCACLVLARLARHALRLLVAVFVLVCPCGCRNAGGQSKTESRMAFHARISSEVTLHPWRCLRCTTLFASDLLNKKRSRCWMWMFPLSSADLHRKCPTVCTPPRLCLC